MPVSRSTLKLQQRLIEELPDDAEVTVWKGFSAFESIQVKTEGRPYAYLTWNGPDGEEHENVSLRFVGWIVWQYYGLDEAVRLLLGPAGQHRSW